MQKCEVLEFTDVYKFGEPFETDAAILKKNKLKFRSCNRLPFFKVQRDEDEVSLIYKMNKNDRVFGLGESLGGVNKRGKKYRLYSTDEPVHTPEKESLYASHTFVLIDGEKTFGFFIDFPGEIIFDVGFSDIDILKITIPANDFYLYIFNNTDKLQIIKEYLKLTGKPYIPPKWAFGYQQCRWSYPDREKVEEIANSFRDNKIPCDAIYLDIDYMEKYKVFTVDKNKFSKFPELVKELKARGFKLIPIIDPGVKIEKNYDVYEEGIKNNYFCKDKDGNNFIAAVWPGYTHFPDFLNPEVREWWGKKYKKFTDIGIDGFWNDMNEPAIFYTPKAIMEIYEMLKYSFNNKNIDPGIGMMEIKDKATKIANRREDYKSFYHKTADGKEICHDDVHNLYGFNMTRATAEEILKNNPEKRYFLLSRSSYSGLHRYSAVWMGDNMSWWEHMPVHMKMLQSLNISGFLYTGADVGGFGCHASPELAVRWMELGAFTPLFRNHSALGTRNQEPFAFNNEITNIMRNIINLRYAFIAYAYSEFMKAADTLQPFIKPLWLEYSADRVKEIEDQYLYGDSLMVAPVYTPNSKGRYVHLPKHKWLGWTASEYQKRDMKVYKPGDYYISADLHEIPLFIRENHLIVLNDSMNYVGEKVIDEVKVIGLVTKKADFIIYEDDGNTYDYVNGAYSQLRIEVTKAKDGYIYEYEKSETRMFKSKIKTLNFEIYDKEGNVFKKTIKI